MYIITNSTKMNEYTPSKTSTLTEARTWMCSCTADNIRSYMNHEYEELNAMTDTQVIEWAKENLNDFEFSEQHSLIVYADEESYNLMNIYNLDEC